MLPPAQGRRRLLCRVVNALDDIMVVLAGQYRSIRMRLDFFELVDQATGLAHEPAGLALDLQSQHEEEQGQ